MKPILFSDLSPMERDILSKLDWLGPLTIKDLAVCLDIGYRITSAWLWRMERSKLVRRSGLHYAIGPGRPQIGR